MDTDNPDDIEREALRKRLGIIDESQTPPGIRKLRQLNEELREILRHPEPGLASWRTALARTLTHLAAYCGTDAAPVATRVLVEKWPYCIDNDANLKSQLVVNGILRDLVDQRKSQQIG